MFFGVGFWECALIMIIVLLVYPPHRLPELASQVGKIIHSVKRAVDKIKNEVQ